MRILLGAFALLVGAAPAWSQAPRTNARAVHVSGPSAAVSGAQIDVDIEIAVEFRDADAFAFEVLVLAGTNLDRGRVVATGLVSPQPRDTTIERRVLATLPADLEGRFTLVLRVDSDDDLDETNEFDNAHFADDPIALRQPKPDVRVVRVELTTPRVQAGGMLQATAVVQNDGEARAEGEVALLLSEGAALSDSDLELARAPLDLAAGASGTIALDATTSTDLAAGTYTVGARYTPDAGVDDRDPVNDQASLPDAVVVTQSFLDWQTVAVPDGVVGFRYGAVLEAAGGDGSFTYAAPGQDLPPGLQLDPGGALHGAPTASGTFTFTLRVQSDNRTADQMFTIEVLPVSEELLIVTDALRNARLRVDYDLFLIAAGGELPYTWSLTSGRLPDGLTLDASGRLRGEPTEVGGFTFTARVEERNGDAREQTFDLTVETSLNVLVEPTPPPVATAGQRYSVQLRATGGIPPYTWSVTNSSLPSGLTLSSDGVLAGTPGEVGSFVFQVEAEDASAAGRFDRSLVFLEIEDSASFSIIAPETPPHAFNTPLERIYRAEGGTPPYMWSLVPGTVLPDNTVFSNGEEDQAAFGVLRGGPNELGNFGIGIRVTDAEGRRREIASALVVTRLRTAGDGGGCRSGPGAASWLLVIGPLTLVRLRRFLRR